MFIAYVVQKDKGCGYTIACGEALWRLDASTKTEAIEELKRKVLGEYLKVRRDYEEYPDEYDDWDPGYWDETSLGKLILFEVSDEDKIDISQWYRDAAAEVEKIKHEEAKVAEREEYERLRKKFEN